MRRHWIPAALAIWALIFGAYEIVERTVLSGAAPETMHVLHILRGTITSFLLAAFAAWFVAGRDAQSPRADELRARAAWLVRLRWIAIAGVATAILAARYGFGLLAGAPCVTLWAIVGVMVVYNVGFMLSTHPAPLAQLLVDLFTLTLLLHFSGGIENPFFSFFVFHVIIAGILLRRRQGYLIAGVACALFCGLVVLEYTGAIAGYPLGLFPRPGAGYIFGMLAAFTATTFFATYFTTTITGELSREKMMLDRILHSAGAALLVADPQGRNVWSNEQARAWFGDGPKWECDHDCEKCLPGDSLVSSRERHANGRDFLVTCSALRDADGRLTHTLELIQDISDRKRMEEQLARAGKLAAIGRLASGIAHEINNPLAAVAASAEFLLGQPADPNGPFPRHLRRIEDHVYRCKEITDSLLGFVRGQAPDVLPTNVNPVVQAAMRAVEPRRNGTALSAELAPDLPPVRAQAGLLQQVIVNLLSNAIDAADAVTVRTSRVDGEVRIAVRDNGPGVSTEHLFEPFHTTKPPGKGTGLGLFLSHQMVEAMGGRIDVTSNGGAEFTIALREAAP